MKRLGLGVCKVDKTTFDFVVKSDLDLEQVGANGVLHPVCQGSNRLFELL